MKRLYNALMLKKLYTLKDMGFNYIEPIEKLEDENITLPETIQELKMVAYNCHLCELSKSRVNVVFGEGNINSDLMFVGDAPGSSEDLKGKIFIGRSGELLTKMIENVLHIPRDSVYISNVVKCRPPNNRAPKSSEALICRAYIFKEIEIVKPKLIVALGSSAYYYLTNDKTPISQIRGSIIEFKESKIMPTFHPSYLLRNPSAKKEAYEDMLKIKEFLKV